MRSTTPLPPPLSPVPSRPTTSTWHVRTGSPPPQRVQTRLKTRPRPPQHRSCQQPRQSTARGVFRATATTAIFDTPTPIRAATKPLPRSTREDGGVFPVLCPTCPRPLARSKREMEGLFSGTPRFRNARTRNRACVSCFFFLGSYFLSLIIFIFVILL